MNDVAQLAEQADKLFTGILELGPAGLREWHVAKSLAAQLRSSLHTLEAAIASELRRLDELQQHPDREPPAARTTARFIPVNYAAWNR